MKDIIEEVTDHVLERICEKLSTGSLTSKNNYYMAGSSVYPNIYEVQISLCNRYFTEKLIVTLVIRTRELYAFEISGDMSVLDRMEQDITNKHLIEKYKKATKLHNELSIKLENDRQTKRNNMFKEAIKNSIEGVIK